MATNSLTGLIPRGSLGLKLLLVCLLVLAMGIPLLVVGALVAERQNRANQVTMEIGGDAGGSQVVGGPMLLVPYTRAVEATDDQGRTQRRTERGTYVVFAETGSADSTLTVENRRLGIYRAAVYTSSTDFDAAFTPREAVASIDPAYRLDWTQSRIVMFVSDSRAIRDAAELRFADGTTASLEPISDLSLAPPQPDYSHPEMNSVSRAPMPSNLQAFAAPMRFAVGAPADFTVESRLVLTGAQRFAIAAFAQDTTATIRSDRNDVRAEGAFQADGAPQQESGKGRQVSNTVSWRVPFLRRGIEKAADLNSFNLGAAAGRDMAVSFVAADDIYNGVFRAVRYGIMFIGIVFLAVLIFEAVSGRKAHPAQYILVGLAQCVFYLLLLSLTELMGFASAFAISAAATVGLLAYYATTSFQSAAIGVRALIGLGLLYGVMYVLMTLEDLAMVAGSVTVFIVIAITMVATGRIDWYGRGERTTETANS